ncbi:MAG: leucyl aminopeptidase [Deltaproteobacteria bacterium]|nr:MAG: leucyl aminopeptidase [Deltaproteobacteria bacterium]
MRIECLSADLRKVKADMVVATLFEGEKRPSGVAAALDAAVGGAVSAAVSAGDFTGKTGETFFLRPAKGVSSPRVLVVGLGKRDRFTPDAARQAMLPVVRTARKLKLSTVASVVPCAGERGFPAAARFAALGAALSSFEFDRYRSEKDHRIARFLFVCPEGKSFPETRAGASRGARLGEAINWGRNLVATPPGELKPADLARAAKGVGKGISRSAAAKIRVRVLGVRELSAIRAGGILAVGKGSQAPPRLIVAEYRGGRPGGRWTALIGKGVTFDTGGISLKKWEGMEKMKYDMAGGAGMLATIRALAALGVPRNVVAVVPAVENMPSGTAYRPGDVLRTMSGKTVEVLSTDAEGRLILADAMTYAVRRYKPESMIDAATLTGACLVALGSVNMGMMGNDEKLLAAMRSASSRSGEKAWELPLHEEYRDQIKSEISDLKNIGGAEAGTITAGWFLREFAGDTPWVHFDIAGTAWIDKEKRGYAPGPSGAPVRLLVEFLSPSRG